jgi:hypothetical protein
VRYFHLKKKKKRERERQEENNKKGKIVFFFYKNSSWALSGHVWIFCPVLTCPWMILSHCVLFITIKICITIINVAKSLLNYSSLLLDDSERLRACQKDLNSSVIIPFKSFRYRSPRCLVFTSINRWDLYLLFTANGWWELSCSIVCSWSVIIKPGYQESLYIIRVLGSFACRSTEVTVNSIHAFNAWEKQNQKGM